MANKIFLTSFETKISYRNNCYYRNVNKWRSPKDIAERANHPCVVKLSRAPRYSPSFMQNDVFFCLQLSHAPIMVSV